MEFGSFEARSGGAAFLAFLAAMVLIEAVWLIWVRKRNYDWRAAGASFGVAIGKRVIDAGTAGIAAAVLFWVYNYRVFTIELNSLGNILLLFILFELVYYWHHRLAHEVRWLWATHSVHHSPEEMNLSVSARLGWTGLVSGSFLFFAPLVLIGFHPIAVFVMLATSLFYQIWIHTELVGKLPRPLEWLLNTPAHHRVHHASNKEYLDKNYGGVLIIWDRIFGTFAEEFDAPKYGLTEPVRTYNPVKLALWEWKQMAKDCLSAKSFGEAVRYMFAPPGWSPDNPRRYSKFVLNNPFVTHSKKEQLVKKTLFAAVLASTLIVGTSVKETEAQTIDSSQIEQTIARLQLSDAQIESAKPIIIESIHERLEILRSAGFEKGVKPTFQQLLKVREPLKNSRTRTETKLSEILTPEQVEEYREITEEARAKLRAKFN